MSFGEIANIYELLQDEDESTTIARIAKEKAEAVKAKELAARKIESGIPSAKAKKVEPVKAAPASAESAPKKDTRRPREGKSDNAPRTNGDRDKVRAPREGGAPRTDRGDRPQGERIPREAREGGVGGKRQFERRSGTGRGKEIKKGGAGKGNWGPEGEETAPAVEGEPAKEPVKEEEGAEAKPTEEGKAEVPKEEEDKTIGYDDYIKQKKEKASLAAPAARQSGEGVDQAEWAEFVPLKREEEDSAAKKEKKAKKEGEKEEAPKKLRVDEVFHVKVESPKRERRERPDRERSDRPDRERSDRDRPDRSGERDKKPTGNKPSFRGGNKQQRPNRSGPAPNISDESSFPALS